jgi:hypothetical protein
MSFPGPAATVAGYQTRRSQLEWRSQHLGGQRLGHRRLGRDQHLPRDREPTLTIHVEHQDDGNRRIAIFDWGTARWSPTRSTTSTTSFYTDRMDPDRMPLPVSEYRQGGQNWTY